MDITLHLLYDEEVFSQTLQAGLLTTDHPTDCTFPKGRLRGLSVVLATFVTDYSGGTVPFSPNF